MQIKLDIITNVDFYFMKKKCFELILTNLLLKSSMIHLLLQNFCVFLMTVGSEPTTRKPKLGANPAIHSWGEVQLFLKHLKMIGLIF